MTAVAFSLTVHVKPPRVAFLTVPVFFTSASVQTPQEVQHCILTSAAQHIPFLCRKVQIGLLKVFFPFLQFFPVGFTTTGLVVVDVVYFLTFHPLFHLRQAQQGLASL